MTQPAVTATRSGTVWTRALALFVVCMVAVGVIALGIITGVIPIQMTMGKNPFQLSVGEVERADRMSAYVGVPPSGAGDAPPGVNLELAGGSIRDLCVSTTLDLPLVAQLTVFIRSGESEAIELHSLTAFATSLEIGDVTVKNVELGRDAATFGVQVESVRDVRNLVADGNYIEVLSIQLRGLGLDLREGEHDCANS